ATCSLSTKAAPSSPPTAKFDDREGRYRPTQSRVRAQDRGSQPLKTDSREVVIQNPRRERSKHDASCTSLTQQQARNKFSIDGASTGEIRVAQPLDLADLNRYQTHGGRPETAPQPIPKSEAKEVIPDLAEASEKVIYIDVDDSAPPVNLLDEAELAAAHTRRNVIIIIILAAVSAVLAIILIVAITCVNRPCCGVYEGGASGARRARGKHRGGRQRRTDGIDAWPGKNIRAQSPIVTTSFALPQSHDASCYYGGGGRRRRRSLQHSAKSARHQVLARDLLLEEERRLRDPVRAKSDQVNFWLYQIKEDAAASPQMQHPRYYQQQQQQQQHLNNFCTISRGQHQVVHYGQPQHQPQQPNHQDQPVADGAQSDSGRGCSDEDLSSGPRLS
uniref:Conserved plasma membrane protein n=1 Tax=Macrostomum lignano TaxID=282301 RepID=A0A1I8JQS1_9PLAT